MWQWCCTRRMRDEAKKMSGGGRVERGRQGWCRISSSRGGEGRGKEGQGSLLTVAFVKCGERRYASAAETAEAPRANCSALTNR